MAAARSRSAQDAARRPWASDPITLYLDEIGRHPLLTPELEKELGRSISAGRRAAQKLEAPDELSAADRRRLMRQVRDGAAATERFVNANLRLVVSVAKRYQSTGVPLLDLIQEGNLGLIRAVDKFDADKGFRFSTYAMWWIRQFIARGIAGSRSSVRLPSRANDDLVRLRDQSIRFEQSEGHPPTISQLAQLASMSERRVADLVPLLVDPLSLSSAMGMDGNAELGDFVADESAFAEVDAVGERLSLAELEELLSGLDDREREILRLRYGFTGEPCSTAEIAQRIGLSRERVRQLEHRGMSKLMHPSGSVVGALLGV